MGGQESKYCASSWANKRILRREPDFGLHMDDSHNQTIQESAPCRINILNDLGYNFLRWPEGRVPYKIDKGLEEYPEIVTTIQQAIDQFHLQTPIKFVELSVNQVEEHYVIFMFDEKDISSDVGRQSYPQTVDICPGTIKGHVMHELMHVLGLYHEHSRPDRDQYLEVSEDIPHDLKNFYEIEGPAIGPYDPDSITHFPVHEFIKTNPELADRMGQREGFSKKDIGKIEYIYGDPKCTYEIFGDDPFPQTNYECITCWGPGTAFAICEYCRHQHHRDCEVIKLTDDTMIKNKIKLVCDYGRNKHNLDTCTKVTRESNKVSQNMYICTECVREDNWNIIRYFKDKVICAVCIEACHSGHRIEELGLREGVCVCSEWIRCEALP